MSDTVIKCALCDTITLRVTHDSPLDHPVFGHLILKDISYNQCPKCHHVMFSDSDQNNYTEQLRKAIYSNESGRTGTSQAQVLATKILGYSGKMICGSKSFYSKQFPKNIVLFNGNICTGYEGKIWYGDIDITLQYQQLEELANKLDCTIYLLYEMDARFENERRPKFDKTVFAFTPRFGGIPGVNYKPYFYLCKRGKNKGRWILKPFK